MTFTDNAPNAIDSSSLNSLHKAGFKLVPLSESHVPVIQWCPIYDNSNYWLTERFEDPLECSRFKNVASTFGKSHLTDTDDKELFIQVLDCDSKYVYNVITKPFFQLNTSPVLKSKIRIFLADGLEMPEMEFADLSLLDVLKKHTFVTKTRKPYGFHVWWLSHNQNESISTIDCKKGYEFEIKTDKKNGLCTLPPSTHRGDAGFRYSAVGRTDKILANDALYDLFIELFKDALVLKDGKKRDVNENSNIAKNSTVPPITFYDISSETIDASASILSPFYVEHNRNNFALCFSGYAHHCRISEESAGKIVSEICKMKEDKDVRERLATLHGSYEKACNGRHVTGGPTLVNFMSKIKECSINVAEGRLKMIKDLWHNDISIFYGCSTTSYNCPNSDTCELSYPSNIVSVTEAKMLHEGRIAVRGKIMTCSGSFKMVSATNYSCFDSGCGYSTKVKHQKPLLLLNDKEANCKCQKCSKPTVSATFEYVNAIELELQDVDDVNEIDRLLVYLFEDNVKGLKIGENVIIDGNITVVNKNDNKRKKLIAALYGNSITYENEKEIVLSQKDIEEIISIKNEKEDGEGWIDYLVSQFAPNIARNYYPKLGLLLAAVNSGPDEIFRKRDRIHVLLVGEPGLAKTKMLEDVTELVPNSKFMSMSNTSGISLTAMIEKDEVGGGGYSVRAGSIVLAKNAIFAANEIGDLNFRNQLYLGDIMEEGVTHISKYTIDAMLVAPVTMVAACNPTGTFWKHQDRIDATEIPLPPKEIDRYDLQFFLRMPREREQLKAFASEITKCDKAYPGLVDYTFMKKVVLYAKQFKPKLTEEAISEIQNYWIEVAAERGSIRIKNILERLTKALAKLRFRDVADIDDANDAIGIYKSVMAQFETFGYSNTIPKNPQYVAADVCAEILRNNPTVDKRVDDLILTASNKNFQVAVYFSGEKTIKTSYKARAVRDILIQNPNIKQVGINPVTLKWFEPFMPAITPSPATDTDPNSLDHFKGQKDQNPDDSEDIQGDECNEGNVVPRQKVSNHLDKPSDDNNNLAIELVKVEGSNPKNTQSAGSTPFDIPLNIESNKTPIVDGEEGRHPSTTKFAKSVDDENGVKDSSTTCKKTTLPSLPSSPSNTNLPADNTRQEDSNNLKQTRIQLHHSKAAEIETNDDHLETS